MIDQVWFTRKDRALPAYGMPDSLSLSEGVVTVTFPNQPFISAIATDEEFEFDEAVKLKRLLSAKINSKGRGILRQAGTTLFMVERQTADQGAIAFHKVNDTVCQTYTLVPVGQELGPTEITIDTGGIVMAHPSQAGKEITCFIDIVLPSVMINPLPVRQMGDDLCLQVLGHNGADIISVVTFAGCHCQDYEVNGELITLNLGYATVNEIELDDEAA